MKKPSILAISCLLFLYSLCLSAQDYTVSVQQFGVEDGLAHRNINTVVKDNAGFLWLASEGGLQRYDGYEFKNYPLIGDKGKIRSIAKMGLCKDEWLWLKTSSPTKAYRWAFYFFNTITGELQNKEAFFKQKSSLDSFLPLLNTESHNIFLWNREDSLFVTSKNHIKIFDFEKGLTTIPLPTSQSLAPHIDLMDSKGNFWLYNWTYDTHVKKISPQGQLIDSFPLRSNGSIIYGISQIYEWEGNIYLSGLNANDQNILYSIDQQNKLQTAFEIPEGYLLYDFNEGYLWCLGDEGWKIFNLEGLLVVELKKKDYDPSLFNGLNYKRPVADQNGKFYLYSEFGFSIITIRENPFTNYFSSKSGTVPQIKNAARGIYSKNDTVLVSFEFGCLVSFEKGQPENYRIIVGSSFNGRPIIRDKRGNFWTGHSGHMMERQADFSVNRLIVYSNDLDTWRESTWALYEDLDGCIWSGHSRALGKYCGEGHTYIDYLYADAGFGFSEVTIYQILPHGTDKFWLTTNKGLFVFDKNTHQVIQHYHSAGKGQLALPADNILYLHIDADNNHWLGTGSGLVFWDTKTGKKRLFDRNDGLANNVIYAVLEDEYNRLWLSSDFGIMSFDKETHFVRSYLPTDGISHEEFNRISSFQEEDGTIYFGGLDGVTAFHPDDFLSQNKTFSNLLVSKYEIFDGNLGKTVDKTVELVRKGQIIFRPVDRFFRIKFTLPTYEGIGRALYAWKIDGIDKNWNYQSENSIQFGALPYGTHTLRIKGQDGSGSWSPHELVLPVKILRPFYLKTWFIIASILAIIGLVALFFKARTQLLKKEITKATATIAQQTEELKALDKLKSRFFANVSHELRTPLSLMLGPIRRLNKNDELDIESKTLLSFLERNTIHLRGLVNEILDLSKLENNKMELKEEATPFHQFITQHLNQFYSIGYSESINVIGELSIEEDLNILLDQNKFTKVINNFISNAIKFSPIKGEVIVHVVEQESIILISVQDEGRGIHPNDLPFVFDRFFQSKTADAPTEGGTGIGLSMCKELAELMNGEVWAESTLSKGSTFYFKFPKKIAKTVVSPLITEQPITSNDETLVPLEVSHPEFISSKASILIAEDNKDLRAYYKIILQDYHVIATENGQEALDYLQNNKAPNLIISDLMMPVMDGMQLVSNIKSSEQLWQIPVIMLTAKNNQQVKIKALRYGIDDYLNKPFDEEELLVRIHSLLQHQSERKRFQEEESENTALKPNHNISKQELEWLEELENYVLNNIGSDILSVSSLSVTFAISESSMLRRIKKTTGLSPLKYLLELRLNHAKSLIENNEYSTISEIAYKVGFKSSNSFSRSFKKRFGKPPKELIASHN